MRKHRGAIMFGLAAAVLVVMLVSTSVGPVKISILDTIRMLLHKIGILHSTTGWQPTEETIVFQVRLPRVLGAALVGAALSTAGVLFQGLLRNPMADPYIIGTASGAAFGATLAMLLPLSVVFYGFGLVPIAAFLGALATVLIVYRLARFGGKAPIIGMLLAGFVVSSFLVAIVILLNDERPAQFEVPAGFLLPHGRHFGDLLATDSSYSSSCDNRDYCRAAIHGTS